MIFSEIPLVYINEINTLIFNFLWNGRDKIERETLYQDFSKGGLNVPSLIQKQDSLIIQTLRRIEINRNQPWANLYIYWFGINLKFYCCEYASNNDLHNIENFEENQNIKNAILKYRINEAISKTTNLKFIYKILMDRLNITTTIAFRYPTSNWDLIWNDIIQFHNPKERLTLFKYIHKILPTGDYFNMLKIFKNIPRCADCWLGQNSLKHIFESCIHPMPSSAVRPVRLWPDHFFARNGFSRTTNFGQRRSWQGRFLTFLLDLDLFFNDQRLIIK